ncbi:Calcium-binding ef-hand family protein [Thalictrum thalictroides]|uniref:Calcium-binding ef-hand family protein n=1 Tax=Thalictrum thalictroides TaxID=46969 RepID=A0A7J6VCE9_THATH|nr:Calcium-binding ef-hand family protein [Thalictrum thalictroides]
MEKTSSNTLSASSSLADFIGFLLFDIVFEWVIGFKKFYLTSRFFFQSQLGSKSKEYSERKIVNAELLKQKTNLNEKVVEDGKLSREEVEMVMRKLRIASNPGDEMLQERLGSNELSILFEDKEPSVGEVKEAFDVFDVNRDGFVDAAELQAVLCSLGLTGGSKMEDCEKMIRVFDENKDGRIDFNEFVKLLENSFC